jgi:hypothetical protein
MSTTTQNTETTLSTVAIQVIKNIKQTIAKSPNGVSFISINGYTNQSGEISNNLLNIGASYANAKLKDIETLKNADLTTLKTISDKITLEIARTELINSLIKPNENMSTAQKEAYTHICEGLKVSNETGKLYIFGFREKKTVITEGTYKETKSQAKTIAKNELKKLLNLRTDKYKNFIVAEITNMKINGNVLEF